MCLRFPMWLLCVKSELKRQGMCRASSREWQIWLLKLCRLETDTRMSPKRCPNGLKHGASMVIVVNPRNRTVQVHTSDGVIELTEADALDGGDVVPGWTMPVADIFS